MHATTPKGIVGGFEFTVFQINLIEWQERPWTYVHVSGKGKQQKLVRQLRCQEQCIKHTRYNLSGLSRAHFFREPFSK